MKTLQLDFHFNRFFRKKSKLYPYPVIYQLPLDLIIDDILIHLCVEDILALRQVDKRFYLLTLTPVIWQRFLERLHVSLPPFRQVFRLHFELGDYEYEDLVKRSICIDRNWKENSCVFTRRVSNTFNDILEMKLVPGGKYLVASVKDLNSMRFYVMVYAMDKPSGPQALVRTQTFGKAERLEVGCTQVDDQDGIMILYTRAVLRNGAPYDPNEKIDPSNPPTYEVVALHVSSYALDLLTNPVASEIRKLAKEQPVPFTEVMEYAFENPIDEVTLFNYQGTPYISVTQNPNLITFVNLLTRNPVQLLCKHEPEYMGMFVQFDRIDAVRVLPEQQEVLVVRSFLVEDMSVIHVLCMYPLRLEGDYQEIPNSQYPFKEDWQYVDCRISDYQSITPVNEWTWKNNYLKHLRSPFTPPPPISVFFRTVEPNGIYQLRIFPEKIGSKRIRGFLYSIYNIAKHAVFYHTNQSVSPPFVLPGAYRASVFTLSRDHKPRVAPEKLLNDEGGTIMEELDHTLLDIGRYVHPDDLPPYYREPFPGDNVTRTKSKPDNDVLPIWCPNDIAAINANGGLRAITFDETFGRLCIVPKLDNTIYIYDYTHLPLEPGEILRRWKRNRAWLLDGNELPPEVHNFKSEATIRILFELENEETHVVYRPPTPMHSIEELEPEPCSPSVSMHSTYEADSLLCSPVSIHRMGDIEFEPCSPPTSLDSMELDLEPCSI